MRVKRLFVSLVVGLLILTGCVSVTVEDKEQATSQSVIVCPCVVENPCQPTITKVVETKVVERVIVKEVPPTIINRTHINIHPNIHPKVDVKVNNHPKVDNKKK